METRLLIAWALIALMTAAAAWLGWRFANRHARAAHRRHRRHHPRIRTMRERWLGL